MRIAPVLVIEGSEDRKLSLKAKCSATWVGQKSCPLSCPLQKSGCYAEGGSAGFTTRRLNRAEKEQNPTPLDLARMESEGIKNLKGKYPIRLHIVGDCATRGTTKLVAQAANWYMETHNKAVWTYTHARRVARKLWGKVSVLRSCHTLNEVRASFRAGYAPALLVKEFKDTKTYEISKGIKGIPCPQQTGKAKDCISCKLCMKDQYLLENKMVILFAAHGNNGNQVKASKHTEL